jgi:hypothetical protein
MLSPAVVTTTLVLGGGVAGTLFGMCMEDPTALATAVAGRIGGPVATWETRVGGAPTRATGEAGEVRLAWTAPPGRIVVDVLPSGRVRQASLGRERGVPRATDPAPGDWTMEEALALAREWLPTDIEDAGVEAFTVGDRTWPRDRFVSRALARSVTVAEYRGARSDGPPGACLAQYYLTDTGRVAFLLVGLA